MIKRFVGRNITVLSKTELDHVRFKYGEIVNSSETLNGDEIDDYGINHMMKQVRKQNA